MSTAVEPPPVQAPDAGVIEEARTRQHRHRVIASATIIAAAGVAAIVLAAGGDKPSGSGSSAHPRGSPAAATQITTVSCGSQETVTGGGSPAVTPLSILSVLRLPPARFPYHHGSPHHLARTLDGTNFYVYTPGPPQCSSTGIVLVSTHPGTPGTEGVGDPIAATIAQQGLVSGGGAGCCGLSFLDGVVPNGVASVTLQFARRPPITGGVVNNVFAVGVVANPPAKRVGGFLQPPVAGLFGQWRAMVWRSANGKVLKTVPIE
jgi:hypothetical protein